jgi:hypothetical protein
MYLDSERESIVRDFVLMFLNNLQPWEKDKIIHSYPRIFEDEDGEKFEKYIRDIQMLSYLFSEDDLDNETICAMIDYISDNPVIDDLFGDGLYRIYNQKCL